MRNMASNRVFWTRPGRFNGLTLTEAAVAMLILLILVAILMPALQPPRDGHPRSQCKNNLKALSFALNAYHEHFGSFPPQYIIDSNGRPIHSWRVLILPFLGYQELYNKYRFDEPWNGPNNSQLASSMPGHFSPSYCCPVELNSKQDSSNFTNYIAIAGPQTMWNGVHPIRFDQVTDSMSSTVLLAEIRNSQIHWMEPRNIRLRGMAFSINHPTLPCISSVHPRVAHVAFVDTSVCSISEELSAVTLHAILTRSGSEVVDETSLRRGK